MEDVTKLPCGEDATPEEESVGGGENGGKGKKKLTKREINAEIEAAREERKARE